jgi:hypothetical protein
MGQEWNQSKFAKFVSDILANIGRAKLAYSDNFQKDFEKLDRDYTRAIEHGLPGDNLGFLYAIAAVLAVAMILIVGLNTGFGKVVAIRHLEIITEIPMTPYVLPNLKPAPPNT